jgi:hypothetical protein
MPEVSTEDPHAILVQGFWIGQFLHQIDMYNISFKLKHLNPVCKGDSTRDVWDVWDGRELGHLMSIKAEKRRKFNRSQGWEWILTLEFTKHSRALEEWLDSMPYEPASKAVFHFGGKGFVEAHTVTYQDLVLESYLEAACDPNQEIRQTVIFSASDRTIEKE